MTRLSKREAARREAEHEAFYALPLSPERPERLQGPGVGERVYHESKHYPGPATVLERSYVWAPDKPSGDGLHRGYRRYDLKVIKCDSGQRLLVDDKDLSPLDAHIHA